MKLLLQWFAGALIAFAAALTYLRQTEITGGTLLRAMAVAAVVLLAVRLILVMLQ